LLGEYIGVFHMKNVNWEKIGVYIVCIGALFMFWQSVNDIKDSISDIKERIAKTEVKIEKLEEK
jgi:hypothetical protein